jgi:hypothetical protein
MRHGHAIVRLLVFAILGVAVSAAAVEDEEFVSLFDGQDLIGWKAFGGEPDTWKVEDGLLVGSGKGGGWLGTRRDYTDFVLRLQFKLSSESNSGVYLRAPADESHISRTGLEIQLLDEYHARYKDIQPWQRTGSIYHVAAAAPGHLKAAGQWNTMEIRAEGPHVVITLNGTMIVDDQLDKHPELEKEHPGLKRASGRIGLQTHNGRVEFRNVQLKELATKRPVG